MVDRGVVLLYAGTKILSWSRQKIMTFLQRSFSTKTFNTPLTYNEAMCSGRHVGQDKQFFNKNVSNVGPNNRQFWRFALKQFSHDLKKFWKELKNNYFSYFEHIPKTNKKQTKLIVGCIWVSFVSLTYSYFRFLLKKIDFILSFIANLIINFEYLISSHSGMSVQSRSFHENK